MSCILVPIGSYCYCKLITTDKWHYEEHLKMRSNKVFSRLPIEGYLDLEERSESRHEFVDGVVVAMVGGTARHNQISTAITSLLRDHLKNKSNTVFMSDRKVSTEYSFYYPDVMVVCNPINPKSLF